MGQEWEKSLGEADEMMIVNYVTVWKWQNDDLVEMELKFCVT